MFDKTTCINFAANLMSWSGFVAAMRNINPEDLSIFMFHGLTDKKHEPHEDLNHLHIHVDDFSAICERLSHHYHVLPLSKVVNAIKTGDPLTPKSVVITFDDGYASNYHLAFPVLKKFNIPASIYVTTGFVEDELWLWPDRLEYSIINTKKTEIDLHLLGQRYHFDLSNIQKRVHAFYTLQTILKNSPQETLNEEVGNIEKQVDYAIPEEDTEVLDIFKSLEWHEINEMMDSGLVEIGGHTHTHRIVGRCSESIAREELTKCTELLEEKTGQRPTLFAYPNGKEGDYNQTTEAILKELGYECALSTICGFNSLSSNPMQLLRFGFEANPRYMDAVASGALGVVSQLKSKLFSTAA